jgi:hypothetical protein
VTHNGFSLCFFELSNRKSLENCLRETRVPISLGWDELKGFANEALFLERVLEPANRVLSRLDDVEKRLVHASVTGQFGMEGGGHGFALADDDRVLPFCGEDFDLRSEALDFWSADENHFKGRSSEEAFANRALELTSIGVAANVDIERAEAGLVWILNFFRQENGAGTGAEGRFDSDEFFELGESGFAQEFQEGARFAAGDDEAVNVVELIGLFDEHNLGAQLFEPFAVRVEITLQGKDPDSHKLSAVRCFIVTRFFSILRLVKVKSF